MELRAETVRGRCRLNTSVTSAVKVEQQRENGAPVRPPSSAPQGGDTQKRKDSPKRSESLGRGEEESGGHRIGNKE